MSSGSYYEEEMSSGGHRRLTAFILWPFPLSKKSLFLTMGLAGRILKKIPLPPYMPSEPHGEGDIAVELWKKLEPGEK